MSLLQRLYRGSVFAPLDRELVAPALLISYFHRASVIIYAIYVGWAIITLLVGIPSITQVQGHIWQVAFSAFVGALSIPAAVGAAYFPKTAKLELYAASGFVGLIAFYVAILVGTGVSDVDILSRIGTAVLVSSVAVVPATRCLFIYKGLVRTGVGRK